MDPNLINTYVSIATGIITILGAAVALINWIRHMKLSRATIGATVAAILFLVLFVGSVFRLPATIASSIQSTPSATNPTSTTSISFGDKVHLLNQYNGGGHTNGGYLDTDGLDTAGTDCQINYFCVSTATGEDRASGSGTWQILSADGKQEGTPLSFGDKVHLLNQYSGGGNTNGGYLDTDGTGCQGNYFCVSTATGEDRASGKRTVGN